jgi:hypothetical protein
MGDTQQQTGSSPATTGGFEPPEEEFFARDFAEDDFVEAERPLFSVGQWAITARHVFIAVGSLTGAAVVMAALLKLSL